MASKISGSGWHLEDDLRAFVTAQYTYPFDTIEPARGSTIGFPDMIFLIDGLWLPVELKFAVPVDADHVELKRIRPAQVRWADQAQRNGGQSFFMFATFDQRIWLSRAATILCAHWSTSPVFLPVDAIMVMKKFPTKDEARFFTTNLLTAFRLYMAQRL